MSKDNLIRSLKDIIIENDYFNTLAGERFKELYDIKGVEAVISFSGRSRRQECYRLTGDSDSDHLYVTHLYLNKYGDVLVQLGSEDTDEFIGLLHPSGELAENYDDETLREWVELLTF